MAAKDVKFGTDARARLLTGVAIVFSVTIDAVFSSSPKCSNFTTSYHLQV